MKIRVYYEDTDAGGIVYHSQYLNFCERARSEVFFEQNLTPALLNGHFVAKKIVADYIASAKLGDILEINTKLLDMRLASFILKQEVFKEGKKIFDLEIVLAYVTYEGKLQKLDRKIKEFVFSLFTY